MDNYDDKIHNVRTKIEDQAIDAIERGASEIQLVSELHFGSFEIYESPQAQRQASYPIDAMIRAHLLRKLMGYSMTELHRRLDENRREAKQLGFLFIPCRTTFGRAWRDRFDDELVTLVERSAKQILEDAHERGNPLGFRSLETEDKSDVSKRTEQRHIKEKTLEVSEEMRELLHGTVDIDRPEEGTQYSTNAFFGLESLLCTEECAAEQGSEIYADNAPRGVATPDADTHLQYLKDLDPPQIFEQLNQAVNAQIKAARRYLEFSRPVEVAIDMTYVAYYGDRDEKLNFGPEDENVVVMGAPPSKGFDWCYKFATVSIVGENVRFMLAVRPHIKGQHLGELVRELYWAARDHVSISTIYADAEFYAAGVIQALEETNAKYLIRARENERVSRQIEREEHDIWVEDEYGIYGPTVDGPGNDRVETTLVGIPKDVDPSETVAFATNFDVDDEIRLDRVKTRGQIKRYSRRWGIETNYRSLSEFLPYTTSKEFSVRLFHFGFAVLVFNMWRLVDFLVQVNLDELEYRVKPRITAKRFKNLVSSVLSMYG